MIRSREEAAKLAESKVGTTNTPGMCQMWTRLIFNAPAVGDVDGDGRADAVDGWIREPEEARHPGDRNPPRGTPVSFAGGGKGDGHRATSIGGGKIVGTDMSQGRYRAGITGVATIEEIERSMGVSYLGWSDTISGFLIPGAPVAAPSKPEKPKDNGVTKARDLLRKAMIWSRKNNKPRRAGRLKKMLKVGPKD